MSQGGSASVDTVDSVHPQTMATGISPVVPIGKMMHAVHGRIELARGFQCLGPVTSLPPNGAGGTI